MLVLLIAAAIFVTGMSEFSLWIDEVTQVTAALEFDLLSPSTYTQEFLEIGHPPLYYTVLRSRITFAGQTDFAMSALSVLAGIATVAVLYRTGTDIAGRPFAGVTAGLLFCSMGYVEHYVHQVHNYSVLMLLTSLLLFFWSR